MSALAFTHIPETKKSQSTIPVSELRKNDIILEGVGVLEPVTVNKVFDPQQAFDERCLTLINSRNSVFYRQFPAEMEVVIKN